MDLESDVKKLEMLCNEIAVHALHEFARFNLKQLMEKRILWKGI